MKKIGLILAGLILLSSVAWASDYVYIIPYRYRYPSIFYSYDYDYRTQRGAYNPYMSQRGFYVPPIYHMLDDDDDTGFLIDPYGGMWFYYNP